MKKIALITLPLLFLVGCNNSQVKPVQPKPQVLVISEVPAPPVVKKPVLDITTLSDADKKDIGIVSKSYVITVDQLKAYAQNLEIIVSKYLELSKQNKTPIRPLQVQGLAAPIPPRKSHEPALKKKH